MKCIIHPNNHTITKALLSCAFLLSCAGVYPAQATVSGATSQVESQDYVCVQRGPNSRLWQKTTLTTNQSGGVNTNINSYTEVCTGACYLQNGQYRDSVAQINIVGTGAQATLGPCKVQWAADASTAGGAVHL